MKHRSLLKVFVLDLVTLGIYFLYWLYATRRELMSLGAKNIPSIWTMFYPLFGLLALALVFAIANLLFWQESESFFTTEAPLQLVLNVTLLLLGAVAVIALIIVPLVWVWRYSKGVDFVTKGQTSHDYDFWLFVLTWLFDVTFIWQLILQNESKTPR